MTVWILGDQLTLRHSALAEADPSRDVVLMVESRKRGAHLRYHKIKLAMVYSAMRHFAEALRERGWTVDYYTLKEGEDFSSALKKHVATHKPDRIAVMEPNSYFEKQAIVKIGTNLPLEFFPPVQFLRDRNDFQNWAKGKKRLLMESHYREMRTRLGLLVDSEGNPEGGQWNLDAENRKTFSDWTKEGAPSAGKPPPVRHDTTTWQVIKEVGEVFPEAPGQACDLWLPVTRNEAKATLDDFITHRLCRFGDFEDLMVDREPTLYHSLLSAPINLGLLEPMECIEAAIAAYRQGRAPLNAVEGFVRQILGWREFINGVYWLKMPEYAESNSLGASRDLPDFFYTGETTMRCLSEVLRQTLGTAYNHHIQRLMILGNFLLLAGTEPKQALRWFSEMYVDAFDWVMAANVLGMSLHADGGFMATKPYVASASYISKMSNYCQGCQFKPSVKTGSQACPFNVLYWNFYDQHADRFASNPRTAMMVKSWRKRDPKVRAQITSQANDFLHSLAGHDLGSGKAFSEG